MKNKESEKCLPLRAMKVFPPLHLSFRFREEVEEQFFREELSFQVEDETKVFLFVKRANFSWEWKR